LHPPAAALALLTSLNEVTDFNFVFSPVFGNTLLLVVCAVVYNTLTKKPYPHHPKEITDIDSIQRRDRFIEEDEINTVLSRYNEVLDISKADLANLVAEVEHQRLSKEAAKYVLQRYYDFRCGICEFRFFSRDRLEIIA
jgi:CBS domain-containing membrane protein